MFKLQRLEITGFKSFADYTEIIFTGDGITAVVGPNGCGKSNVSDAIAWVLGEQRAKSLRGEEMKDVIFQGTSKRKPSGMSEVVLHMVADEQTFDEDVLSDIDEALGELDEQAVEIEQPETENVEVFTENLAFNAETDEVQIAEGAETAALTSMSAATGAAATAKAKTKRHWRPRKLELDFMPGEAVSVTRRLYLSGESEYLLNGKACRLRDIQDLFSGTGLSGAHYALIEQGRIGQILSAKPTDRRSLIEEAAGISKFRTRQRAAEARLESAKTNLRRISDIVEEIEKQANALRRQAAKTRRYKIMREELRELLRRTFAAEGKFYTELVTNLEKRLVEAVKREREIFWEVTGKDEAFRSATKQAREAEESLSAMRSVHAENALQRDRAARELHYKEEQIVALKSRAEVLKGEIQAINERIKLIRAEAERLQKDERKHTAEAAAEELNLRKAEEIYQRKISEVRAIEADLEKIRAELMRHTAAGERLAEIEKQHVSNIERLTERASGLRREAKRAEEVYAGHVADQKNLESELAKAREKSAKLRREKQDLSEQSHSARIVLQSSEKALMKLREDFSRVKNRLETLQELEEKRAIYAPAVQKIFAEQKKIGVEFNGTLADKLNVEAEAEKAVENVFGAFLQTVLVETEADAVKTIDYLNAHNLGRISVLAAGKSEKQNGAGANKKQSVKGKFEKTKLEDFLGASDNFIKLLENVFPREMSVQFVDNFERIKTNSDENFVNAGGDLIYGGKLFVGGKAGANEKSASVLAFKRELRELESKGKTLKSELEEAEKETAKARKVLSEKENQIVDLQAFISQSERDLLAQEIQAKTLGQEIERSERHKRVVADETRQIESETEEVKAKLKEAKSSAATAEKARAAAAAKVSEIAEKLNQARMASESENTVLYEKRTAAATSAERRRSAQFAFRRVEAEQKELESRIARQNLEIIETEGNLTALNASIAEIKSKMASAGDEQNLEEKELSEAAENLKKARENSDAMSAELAELNRASAEARNVRAELEVQQAENVTRLKNLNEICSHELSHSLVELVETIETPDDFDLEESRKQIDDLRRRIEGFGAINMLALEELSETEERLLFLTSQREDIINGISAAEEALREIKQRSRERFKQAFDAINGYFREFFLELFGGGRGEMVLLDAEDVLESGIEIVAQPPGKRLQSILLLSGGEKAMTAIALVMAIFQFRPSPFCLLDEVDAPLDDANVGRFVNKIAEMSANTQFIVITHNKRTMEAAKALYGVTMSEPGVSRVVSVRFE